MKIAMTYLKITLVGIRVFFDNATGLLQEFFIFGDNDVMQFYSKIVDTLPETYN